MMLPLLYLYQTVGSIDSVGQTAASSQNKGCGIHSATEYARFLSFGTYRHVVG
jgi:hypothetical protein